MPFRIERAAVFPAEAVAADLDGDGRDEVVSIYRPTHNALRPGLESVIITRGDGNPLSQANFYARVLPPHVIDLEGDQRPEILVPFVRSDSLFVTAIDGQAEPRFTFFLVAGVPRVEPTGTIPWDPGILAFYLYDTDGDHRAELVSVVSTGYARAPRGIVVHTIPDGTPRGQLLVGAGLVRSYMDDFDGDGNAEVLLECVATNNGASAGGLDDSQSYFLVVSLRGSPRLTHSRSFGPNSLLRLHVGDFTGDRRSDVITVSVSRLPRRSDTELQLLESGTWRVARRRGLPGAFVATASGEFDSRHGAEIAVASLDGEVLLLDGSLSESRRSRGPTLSVLSLVSVPDMDGDGMAELLAQPPSGTRVVLGPDAAVRALGPDDSLWWFATGGVRPFWPDRSRPAQILFRAASGASTYAVRLVPNQMYLAYRYGPPLAVAFGVFGLPAFGIGMARLRRRNHRLRLVQSLALDSAPFGSLLVRHNGHVEWMNSTLRGWLDLPNAVTARKRRAAELFADIPELLMLCQEVLASGAARHRERRGRMLIRGRERSVDFVAEPIQSGRSGSDWLVRIEDTTEDSAAIESRTWALMAQRVAHDLKNPLTSMLLTVQRMRREYHAQAPDAAQVLDEYCRRIEDRIGHLRRMTSNFMKLVRADDPDRTAVSLNALVEGQAQVLRATLPPDIDLQIEAAGDNPVVLADSDQLASVVENLVANSVNALPDGGSITLAASTARGLRLAGHAGPADYAVLEIMDTGVGIPADMLRRVFDPGFTTSAHGSGLGLAIVRKIVRDHDGDVIIESDPGAGTVVSVYLPLSDSHDRANAALSGSVPRATA